MEVGPAVVLHSLTRRVHCWGEPNGVVTCSGMEALPQRNVVLPQTLMSTPGERVPMCMKYGYTELRKYRKSLGMTEDGGTG